jgi:SulP family sulfate permease
MALEELMTGLRRGKGYMMVSGFFSGDFKKYARFNLSRDLIAAITVTMVAVPQAMAYAVIVGVNPVYGLYAAIIAPVIASIFASSNHVVTGPTNTIALATSGVLVLVVSQSNYPEFVFAVAILSGIFRLFLGLIKQGALIRYVSNSVLTGFLTGAATLIMLNQLPKLLGIPTSAAHNLLGIGNYLYYSSREINFLVLGLGVAGIFFLLIARRLFPKLPASLGLLVLSGAVVHLFGWEQQGVHVVGEMGEIGLAGMQFHIPEGVFTSANLNYLITGSGAVALLSLLEAVSVAKSISLHTGQRIDANREFVGQGLASIASGLFHGLPTSGSLTRSAVNFNGGAVTRASSGFSGILVLFVLLLFREWIGYIPEVVLAAIVIVSAMQMIDPHHIAITWRGRSISKVVIGATFISILLLPLQIAIFLGVGLSILFYLIESSHLKVSYLVLNGNNLFAEKSIQEIFASKPEIAIVNVEGPLYFAAVQELEDQVTEMIEVGVKLIVLRFRRMHMLASSGISALEVLNRRARKMGSKIRLTGISSEVMHTLHDCGLEKEICAENIFIATEIPYESTRKAIEA